MIAHHVLFWLKEEITDEQKQAFREALQALEKIDTVKTLHIGTPVSVERPAVDPTYGFSLFVFFEDMAAYDVYEVHPLHLELLNKFGNYFDKVIIYDAD